MKLWKYSGTFLTWTGIIHTIYAFFIGKDALGKMLGDGLADSVGEDYERGFAFWFLICGIFTVAGCIFVPVSGFWLFLPQAVIIIYSNRTSSTWNV